MQKSYSIQEALTAYFGEPVSVLSRIPLSGGDINDACRLSLSNGAAVFCKRNALRYAPMLEAEVAGLEALRHTGAIGVPEIIGYGIEATSDSAFLLLEYLESARRIPRYWEEFGHALAALHQADTAGLVSLDSNLRYGFSQDNFIGRTPQKNAPRSSWVSFFRDCRLRPQIELAAGYWDGKARKQLDHLLDRLEDLLPEPAFPSLLHGDLWGGNAMCGPDGKAWIFDPAVSVGHFEADLAMTELFGGFSPAFYLAYHEANPIDKGYRGRRDLYNLYHLLNHLNLFGPSYYSSVLRILRRYG